MPDYYSGTYSPANAYGTMDNNNVQSDNWQDNPWINNFATRGALSGLGYLGETLGKPQQALYGLASGLMKGDPVSGLKSLANLIPFSDAMGLTNAPGGLTEHRIEGRDLLRQAGAVDGENNWGNFASGLALDLASDPLAFVRGPLGALTKAGEASAKGLAGAAPLERTLAGRIGAKQGGWLGIADRPWYAEMMGLGKQEPLATLGMGKYGLGAAENLDKGWSAATRATIPGTDFSPVAWLRSAFEKGAGNVTGYGPIVDEYGRTVAHDTDRLSNAARAAAYPLQEEQSRAVNDLLSMGNMSRRDAELAVHTAGTTGGELGPANVRLPTNATAAEEARLRAHGDYMNKEYRGVVDPQRATSRKFGVDIGEDENIWNLPYMSRAKADAGNKITGQQMARDPILGNIPGGTYQVEEFARNPSIAGYAVAKTAGQPFDAAAVAAKKAAAEDAINQSIVQEAQKRLKELSQFNAAPTEAQAKMADLASNKPYAKQLADYFSTIDPKIPERGYMFRQDIGTGAQAYGEHLAVQMAPRIGTLNVLSKESKPINELLTAATNTTDVVPLRQALNTLEMKGAEEELMTRAGAKHSAISTVDDLDNFAVSKKLVDKLKLELASPKQRPENIISKLSNAFRYGVTVPWIANLVRNWGGELVNEAVSGTNPLKGLAASTSFGNKTLTDVAELGRQLEAKKAGHIGGVLDQNHVRDLLGTGMTSDKNLMLDVLPVQTPRTTGQVAMDFIKPVYSEQARRDMGQTPFKELMGYGERASVPMDNAVVKPFSLAESASEINRKDWYHGSGTSGLSAKDIDTASGKPDSLFGMGFYMTDAEKISAGYAKSRGKSTGSESIYQAKTNVNKVLNIEKSAPQEVIDLFKDSFNKLYKDSSAFDDVAKTLGSNPTTKDLFDAFRKHVSDISHEEMLPAHEFYDNFYTIESKLRGMGYDALTHTGGKNTGNAPHQVMVMLDPNARYTQGVNAGTVASLEPLSGITQPTASSPLQQLANAAPQSTTPPAKAGLMNKAISALGDYVIDPFRGYTGAMETAHEFQNKTTRLQQIRSLMDEGYSGAAAAERAGITQRRYDQLTPFEQTFMRNVVPFYNFSSANLKSQLDSISRNPGRYNAMLTGVNSGRTDDSFVPAWASSGTAIPLPGAPEGSQRFLGSLGLPAEDEAIGALAALMSGHPIEAIRRAASSSNPIMKTPYEMATGRQIFSGRDLADLKPSPAISGVLGDNQFSRGLTEALTGTPLSRVFSTTDRLMNMEKTGPLATLLNLGTGARVIDVAQDQAASIAAKEVIKNLLKESGKFKTREDVYLKPEYKGNEQDLPPELLQLMGYYKHLQNKGQAAARSQPR